MSVVFPCCTNWETLVADTNVSEQNQKHFLCPGHKICVRNKCCARGQTGKLLCRQQCVLVCQERDMISSNLTESSHVAYLKEPTYRLNIFPHILITVFFFFFFNFREVKSYEGRFHSASCSVACCKNKKVRSVFSICYACFGGNFNLN